MNDKPLQTINIHDYLLPKLCDLYENDCIFDKFECTASPDGKHVVSGSYQNYFNIYNRETGSGTSIEALKAIRTAKKVCFLVIVVGCCWLLVVGCWLLVVLVVHTYSSCFPR